MSKERELLKRVRDALRELKGTHYNLYWDIQSMLDQPEQEQEQTPVGIVITIGGYPDDSQHTVKLTCRHRDLKDGDLLYTKPPQREPLTDEEVRAKYKDIALDNPLYIPSYYAGFRDAEQAHGIGGGK